MELFDFIGLLGCIILTVGLLAYSAYDINQRKKTKPWRELAAANNLTYHAPSKFFKGRDVVSGAFRGYHLKLEILGERIGREEGYTSITLSTNNPGNSRLLEPEKGLITVDPSSPTEPLEVFTTSHQLRGQIKGGKDPEIVQYRQAGVEADRAYLQSVFDLLGDVADAYSFALALEGKAIPGLQETVKDNKNKLRPVALQLIEDITKTISTRLSDSNANLLCLDCLAHFKTHRMNLPWLHSFDYYGCRLCHGTQDYFEGWVIAVLDGKTEVDSFQQDGELWINWLVRRELFDFDGVTIIQATDEEVERFAVQVGNDTDPFREPRYKQTPCFIAPDCDLSENTIRILQRMFGQVEVRESISKLK